MAAEECRSKEKCELVEIHTVLCWSCRAAYKAGKSIEVDPHSWDVGAVEFAFNASAGPGQCRPVKIRPRSGLCFLAIVIPIIIPVITNTTIIIDI